MNTRLQRFRKNTKEIFVLSDFDHIKNFSSTKNVRTLHLYKICLSTLFRPVQVRVSKE